MMSHQLSEYAIELIETIRYLEEDIRVLNHGIREAKCKLDAMPACILHSPMNRSSIESISRLEQAMVVLKARLIAAQLSLNAEC